MKARSVVLIHIQKPITLFGIPVPLLAATGGAAFLGFFVFILLRILSLSFVVLLGILLGGLIVSYKIAQKDWHVVTVYQTSKAFWQKKKKIILVTGKGDEP